MPFNYGRRIHHGCHRFSQRRIARCWRSRMIARASHMRLGVWVEFGKHTKSQMASLMPLHVDQVVMGPMSSSYSSKLVAIGLDEELTFEPPFSAPNGSMGKAISSPLFPLGREVGGLECLGPCLSPVAVAPAPLLGCCSLGRSSLI